MATNIKPLLTVADLELMPDDGNRYELLAGELVVSRAPRLTHQRISGNVFVLLRSYLDQNPIGEVIATPGVIFDEFNSVIPDLIFLSHERAAAVVAEDRLFGAADLVIEILSPGDDNARRDRVTKRQIYGRFGVDEYWIIDPEQQTIEVYRLQVGGLELSATVAQHEELTSSVLPNFVCRARDIFRR